MGLEIVREAVRWQDPVRAEPGFLEITGATLLVGRVLPFRGRGEELLERWDGWSSAIDDEHRCAVPAHDLSRFEEYARFEGRFRIAIGVAIASVHADDGPSPPFDTAIDRALDRARRHERVFADLARDLPPLDAWSLRVQRTRPLLVPFGPIPSAKIAFGTRVGAAAPIAPGDSRARGRDMHGRPHDQAIDGVTIAIASDWDIAEPILQAPERPGAFHLIARYD